MKITTLSIRAILIASVTLSFSLTVLSKPIAPYSEIMKRPRQENKAGQFHYLQHCHKAHVCNGVYLVARHGKPIFIHAFGEAGDAKRSPLSTNSSFDIGSISKQFTAMAILKLEAEGKLSTSDDVSLYLPEFPYSNITIAQLLSHTSGIPDISPEYTKMVMSGPLQSPITFSRAVSMLVAKDAPLVFESGARYEYSNTGYFILANLVEKVADQPFDKYLERTFFNPLGMKDTLLRTPSNAKFISHRAFGFEPAPDGTRKAYDQIPGFYMRGAGGIYTTAHDLLRWENALLSGQVVPKRLWIKAITPTRLSDESLSPYGFGLSLKPDGRGERRVSHGGHWRAFKSDLSYFPRTDLTVVALTNNAENESVEESVTALEAISDGGGPKQVLIRIGPELYSRLDDSPKEVQSWFTTAVKDQSRRYDIQEKELNTLGYAMLKRGASKKAVLVFQLNTIAFPHSPNAYDSLADAYVERGEARQALDSIRSAIALDPTSIRLQKRRDGLIQELKGAKQTRKHQPVQ